MILNYDFTAINEGELPSVIVQRNINKDNYHLGGVPSEDY